MENKKIFGGTKVIIGCCITLFCELGFLALYAAAYALLPEAFGVTISQLSLFTTMNALAGFFANMIASKVIKKIGGYRKALALGAVFCIFYGLCLGLMKNAWALGLAFFIGGVTTSFSTSAVTNAIIANWFSKKKGRFFGITLACGAFGGSAYQLVGGYVFNKFGLHTGFLIITGVTVAVLAINLLTFLRYDDPHEIGQFPDGENSDPEPETTDLSAAGATREKSILRRPLFWLFALGAATDCASIAYVSTYATMYFTDAGMEYTTATTILSILTLSAGLVVFVSGSLVEKIGLKPFLWLVYGACAVCDFAMIIFWNTHSWVVFGVILITYTIGFMACYVGQYVVYRVFKSENTFNGNTKYCAFLVGGNIVVMPLFGFIVEKVGYNLMYAVCAVFAVLSLIIYLVVIRLSDTKGKI